MAKDQTENRPRHQTQAKRRTRYGLNVTLAVLLAAALAVLVNWIVHRQYASLGPESRDWLRLDLTATRQHSLSDQTRQVLGSLEADYRLVSVVSPSSDNYESLRDLADEYAAASGRISVEHVQPGVTPAQREKLLRELQDRYADQLPEVEAAIAAGRDALEQAAGQAKTIAGDLEPLTEPGGLGSPRYVSPVQKVIASLGYLETQHETLEKQLGRVMDGAMPDYVAAKTTLVNVMEQLSGAMFSKAADQLGAVSELPGVPAGAQDTLLGAARQLRQAQEQAEAALLELDRVDTPAEYDGLRQALSSSEVVLVIGPEQVRALEASKMLRREGSERGPLFFGEQMLTGALASMNRDQRPLVVFVSIAQGSVLGPKSPYQHVVNQLRNAQFEVTEWSPQPRRAPSGEEIAPGPPPEPKEGQPVVWIALPLLQSTKPGAIDGSDEAKTQVLSLLEKRMDAGDATMFMLAPGVLPAAGESESELAILKRWGIEPQLDRVVLHKVVRPDGKTLNAAMMQVEQWPNVPVAQAVRALPTVVALSCPVELRPDAVPQTTVKPLIRLHEEDMWTETLSSLQAVQQAEYDPEAAAETFTVAALAERNHQRLIAVTDPMWGQDKLTATPQTPGNAQLFLSSVYWLAGMDEMIAAGPQEQMVRRVGELGDSERMVYGWGLMAGLPAVVVLAGVGVALVRRRS
ncbi:MAG: hypothetical protein ACOCTI_00070 [Phycisphaeraceae bacterium]